jgi:energy-converting hydrogenase Eha subunit E
MRPRTCRAHSSRGRCRGSDPGACQSRPAVEGFSLVLVRFLLFLALAAIGIALGFYVFKRDRRYLRFIAQVVKYTILLMLAVLLFYAFERLVAMA